FLAEDVSKLAIPERSGRTMAWAADNGLPLSRHPVGREVKQFVLMKRAEGKSQLRRPVRVERTEHLRHEVRETGDGRVDSPLEALGMESHVSGQAIDAPHLDGLPDQFAAVTAERLNEALKLDGCANLEDHLGGRGRTVVCRFVLGVGHTSIQPRID